MSDLRDRTRAGRASTNTAWSLQPAEVPLSSSTTSKSHIKRAHYITPDTPNIDGYVSIMQQTRQASCPFELGNGEFLAKQCTAPTAVPRNSNRNVMIHVLRLPSSYRLARCSGFLYYLVTSVMNCGVIGYCLSLGLARKSRQLIEDDEKGCRCWHQNVGLLRDDFLPPEYSRGLMLCTLV